MQILLKNMIGQYNMLKGGKRHSMRKKDSLIILFISFLLLSGCSSNWIRTNTKKDDSQKMIAVSTIGPTHTWPEGVLYYAKEEVKKVAEENNWHYVCVVGNDSNEQSDQVIKLIEQGVDCIIMLPMDGASLKTAAKAVQKAKIPLVIFDREIPDFAPTATVKGDNPGIGIKTAEVFNEKFPEGTTVLELMGDSSTVPFQRTAGYDDTIHENFRKIQLGYTGWQRTQAKELFQTWVEKNTQEEIDEVESIFTHDDEIALGVLDALDEYKQDISFGKTFDNLKVIASSSGSQKIYHRILIEKDYYLFSMTYSPTIVEEAVRIGEKIMKDEKYEEMTVVPTILVDSSNVNEFLRGNLPF